MVDYSYRTFLVSLFHEFIIFSIQMSVFTFSIHFINTHNAPLAGHQFTVARVGYINIFLARAPSSHMPQTRVKPAKEIIARPNLAVRSDRAEQKRLPWGW